MRTTLPTRTPWRTSGDRGRDSTNRTRTPQSEKWGWMLGAGGGSAVCPRERHLPCEPHLLIRTTGTTPLAAQVALGVSVPSMVPGAQ